VLAATAIVVVSRAFAPARGLVWAGIERRRRRRQIRTDAVLADLYALAAQHEGEHAHDLAVLEAVRAGSSDVRRTLGVLERQGYARQDERGAWLITDDGRAQAKQDADEH
jgi:manganese/zinc/iron transport system permease protein